MRYEVIVNGVRYDVEVKAVGEKEIKPGYVPPVASAPSTPAAAPQAPVKPDQPAVVAGANSVQSPMPGKVLSVLVKEGDVVEKDQLLLVLEAMKMENEIRSPAAGKISEVLVFVGAQVESGEVLINLE